MLQDRVFRQLLEAAPDGIVIVDGAGRVALVNTEAEHLFGYSSRELLGRPVEVLVPARLRSVHSMHRSAFLDIPRSRSMGAGLTLMGRRKDGTEFPVEISLSPVDTDEGLMVAAIIRDVSERRRTEETIRSQAELLESAHDAIIVLDLQRRVQYWNAGAERTYGWTAEEALGQAAADLLGTAPVESTMAEMIDVLNRDSIWEGELDQRTQDGRQIVVTSRQTVRRRPDGTPISILEINRDITEHKRLELERAAAELEAHQKQERDRIAMDLHDGVIQSIYAVGLNLELASQEVDAAPAEARGHIEESIERLRDVMAEIRDYIFALRDQELGTDVTTMISSLASRMRDAGGVAVEMDIEPGLPVLGDACVNALYHVAQEALTNTVRHASPSRITLSVRNHDRLVTLTVEDDGVGFDASSARGNHHNGLRNMAARAEAAGGELVLESNRGAGTRVTLRLPVEDASAPSALA